VLRINDVEVSAGEIDLDRLRAVAGKHGRRVAIDTDPGTPYKCVGGVVFTLQRAGFRTVSLSVNGVPLPAQGMSSISSTPNAAASH